MGTIELNLSDANTLLKDEVKCSMYDNPQLKIVTCNAHMTAKQGGLKMQHESGDDFQLGFH